VCGFVAVVGRDGKPVVRADLERMRDVVAHRGPDDAGLYLDGPVGLGHRRLSILDISSAGRQPISNEDETVWLVFNGEIYNFVELAAVLQRRGHRFRSHTDSEVIVHLYEDVGTRCVEYLCGMFAFVIWDARQQQLFGARDRTGMKPFHYYNDRRRFICASEIKSILADDSVPRVAQPEYFADYLYAGYSLDAKTPFRDIHQLLPGHLLTLRNGQLRTEKYWDVVHDYEFGRSHEQITEELRSLLDESIQIHCRSDASLGSHLSGGLDSSTVVSFAARHRERLPTFSIRFEGHPYFDETAFAKALARHVGVEYFEASPSSSDLRTLLPALLWHLEVPMPTSGGFAYYASAQLAAQHAKVVLTGHGGDEVFAGYPAQFQAAFGTQRMFSAVDLPAQWKPNSFQQLWRELSRPRIQRLPQRVRRYLWPPVKSLENIWVSLHCGPPPQDSLILHDRFVRSLNGYSPREPYLSAFKSAGTDRVLDRCLYHDLRSYLPGLLHMEDRLSMAVSVESRAPLLDHRIIEFLATVPPEQKLPSGQPKELLRAAAAQLLPRKIRERRSKLGFPVPLSYWLRDDLNDLVKRVLLSRECADRGVLDPRVLRAGYLTPGEIWAAFNIELWFKIFIDRDPEWCQRTHLASQRGRSSELSNAFAAFGPAVHAGPTP
jgi:asparagine synthase (glutamine-hydrolysing)